MPEDNIPSDSLSLPFPAVLGPMVVLLPATKVVSASEDNDISPLDNSSLSLEYIL